MKQVFTLLLFLGLFGIGAFVYIQSQQQTVVNIPTIQPPLDNVIPTKTSATPITSPTQAQGEAFEGTITDIQDSSRPSVIFITLLQADTRTPMNIEVSSSTVVTNEDNTAIQARILQKGDIIRGNGSPTEGALAATELQIIGKGNPAN